MGSASWASDFSTSLAREEVDQALEIANKEQRGLGPGGLGWKKPGLESEGKKLFFFSGCWIERSML